MLIFVKGCAVIPVAGIGSAASVSAGLYALRNPESVTRPAKALGKTLEEITPEQEYYIGRAVAATVLRNYPPYADERANRYINLLGQTLAKASDRPETFHGYHFLIVDSEEINAFAAPGGLVMVTRGMLRQCGSEDELAAVLAHEIGHIEHQNGLKAIQQSRLTSAAGILASEGAKILSGGMLAPVVEAFEGSVGDIASTVIKNGYSREQERQADESAVTIMRRVGYDPGALVSVLQGMPGSVEKSGPGFTKSHPKIIERIRYLEGELGVSSSIHIQGEREKRFKRFIAGV